MSVIEKLYKNGHLRVEQTFIVDTCYQTIMGSTAYGVSQSKSDLDIHAICTPPIEMVFPHLNNNYIRGFGPAPQNFETFQQHHIMVDDKNYDVAIYGIVKAFQLAADNNPNMLDILWVPENCILHMDSVGQYIRKNRKHFLHKGSHWRFRGYAASQIKKIESSNRKELIEAHGTDTKAWYHVIRLGLECQQILEEGDLDITRHAEVLKSIRRGEWSLDKLKEKHFEKEKELDELYTKSTLQYEPNMDFLKEILLACLEMKYGSLKEIYKQVDNLTFRKLEEIKRIVNS